MNESTRGIRRWIEGHFIALSSTLLVSFLMMPYLIANMFVTIDAGHRGALWSRFFGGTQLAGGSYGEGTKVILPWDKIYVYDTRVQHRTERFDVLTSDGLQISIEATARFRLRPDSLAAITAYAGPDYINSLLMPSLASVIRLNSAKYTVEEIYSSNRETLENSMLTDMRLMVDNLLPKKLHEGREIDIYDFRFRNIILPPSLTAAIENKLSQNQSSQQYKYILTREEQEKERKRIEAQGIKAFQDIVSSGISENYLRWKGIDATLKLADSPNAKIVIIGGKEGLPLILGPLDSATSPAAPLRLPGVEPPAASSAASPPHSPTSVTGRNSDSVPSSSSASPPPIPAATTASKPTVSMPFGAGQLR